MINNIKTRYFVLETSTAIGNLCFTGLDLRNQYILKKVNLEVRITEAINFD